MHKIVQFLLSVMLVMNVISQPGCNLEPVWSDDQGLLTHAGSIELFSNVQHVNMKYVFTLQIIFETWLRISYVSLSGIFYGIKDLLLLM
jgi:hypothetical protein